VGVADSDDQVDAFLRHTIGQFWQSADAQAG